MSRATRGRLSGKLYLNLRHQHKRYRKRFGSHNEKGPIKHRIFIDERPKIVDEKIRLGDWEVDTVIGSDRHHSIVTLAERLAKKCICKKVESKKATLVRDAVFEGLKPFSEAVLTITSDNSSEFAEHEKIQKLLSTHFYFAHPYSSWERGLNETTNGLLRQYFPRGNCFKEIKDEQLIRIAEKLNNRPRKTLNYLTPNEALK